MTMTCDQASARLVDLPAESKPDTDLALHLAGCDACRRRRADQAFVRQALAMAVWPARPTGLEEAGMPHPSQLTTLKSPSLVGRQRSADPPTWSEGPRSPVGRGPSGPRSSTSRLGRGWDLAFLGAIATVIALVLARSWSAGRSAGPSPLVSRGDSATETPLTTPTASVAAPTVTAAAAQAPDWVLNADPKRIGIIPVPDETQLLTGYDLLIDQELDFTLSPLWTVEDDAVCEAIWLDWGDGLGEDLPCRSPRAALPETRTEARYPLKHRYRRSGPYRPQLWMRQRPGAVLNAPAADFFVLERHVSQGPRLPAERSQGVTVIPDRALALNLFLLSAMLLLFLWLATTGHASATRLAMVPSWIPGLLAIGLSITLLIGRSHVLPRETVEPLIGRRGLDPLRPDVPLVQVTSSAGRRTDLGMLRLRFADEQEQVAEPPAITARSRPLRTEYGVIVPQYEDALGRLRSVHAPLDLPFVDPRRDGIVLDLPKALPRDPAADEALVFKEAWYRAACLSEGNLIPSPDEQSVILPRRHMGALTIYLMDLVSGTLAMTHPLVRDVAWSPDSRWLVSRGADSRGARDPYDRVVQLVTLTLRDLPNLDVRAAIDIELESGYAASADGIWLARADGVWRIDWPGAAVTNDGQRLILTPRRVFAWPADLDYQPHDAPRWLVPEPEGRAVAYGCRAGVCLVNASGVSIAAIPNAFPGAVEHHAVWRADGLLLALVDAERRTIAALERSSYPWQVSANYGPVLRVIDAAGNVRQAPHLPPTGVVSPPRWTADGRWLILTTCPLDGRRIVAIDADRGVALDLSQAGWDAWATLLPKSGDLLLHNGRGGLWRSRLTIPPASP